MRNLKDIVLERLVLTRRESFNHTLEDIWEIIYNMSYHEYSLEDDDEFFEDLHSLPLINNLPGNWKSYNGWSVTEIKATGNRELWDFGPDHEDAIKMLELELIDLQNPKKRVRITIESDDEYTDYLEERAREILYIALKEQLS